MEMRTVQKLLSIALLLSVAWVGLSTSVYGQSAISPWPMFRHDPQHTGRSPYRGPDTPELKWEYETGGPVRSSPAIGSDGTVYVGSHDKNLYAINSDGSLRWAYWTGGSVKSSPAIGSDGTVYVGSLNLNYILYAINPDGSLKWKYKTEGWVWSSPALGSDGTVYVGSGYLDKNLYAINPDGSLKWKYETGHGIDSSPAIGSDGTVYVGSLDDNLYAINPDGSLKWRYKTGDRVFSSPAIGSDGTIYVGSNDKKIYAIGGVVTGVEEEHIEALPRGFSLSQNFPNPFNATTEIRYQLSKAVNVRLVVCDILGRRVETLVDGAHDGGYYSVLWDGLDSDGQSVASGVYLYRLETENKEFVDTKRTVLIR